MREFTTKQIAELLGVSKPTVQKEINKLALQPERRENNNRAFYSYDDTVAVIKAIRPNYDVTLLSNDVEDLSNDVEKSRIETAKPQTEKPQNELQNTEKPQNLAQTTDEKTAKLQNEELEFLKRALSVIEAQLAEKDKQLAVKDKQIQDLSDRLAEANQLIKGQQYITAADKTTELLEADSKRDQKEEVKTTRSEEQQGFSFESNNDGRTAGENNPQPKKSFWQRLFGR